MAAPTASPPAKPAVQPPPGTAAERAEVLISVMERLGGLLSRELDALRRGALPEIVALQGEKRDLGTRFDEIGRLLRLDRAGLAALSPDLLARLKSSGARFADIAHVSRETLDIAAEAQKWVVEVVVKTVNQDRKADAAYSRSRPGFVPRATRPPPGRPATYSITL